LHRNLMKLGNFFHCEKFALKLSSASNFFFRIFWPTLLKHQIVSSSSIFFFFFRNDPSLCDLPRLKRYINYTSCVHRFLSLASCRILTSKLQSQGANLYKILIIRLYPKVSGLAAWSDNCKWYSSLPLGAVVSLFCESV
jgi:hypothetical protein